MRPLIRPAGCSRTSVLPINQRASRAAGTGSSSRWRGRSRSILSVNQAEDLHWREPAFAQGTQRERASALSEAATVGASQQFVMGVARRLVAQQTLQQAVDVGRGQQVLAARHQAHTLEMI